MAGSINKVILVGRITHELEVKKTATGVSYCRFQLAVNRRYAKAEDKVTADFIACVAWRNSADILGSYAHKGSLVGVEGQLRVDKDVNNQSNQIFYSVQVDNIDLLGTKNEDGQRQNDNAQFKQEEFIGNTTDDLSDIDEHKAF